MDHNVLITGASGGIGCACAEELAKLGFGIAFGASRDSEKAREKFRSLKETGTTCVYLPFDVKDENAVLSAVKEAKSALGYIDTLICCAGVAKQELFQFTTEQDYDRIMDINVKGSFLCAKALLPDMINEKRGNIVFVSSMWGEVGGSCEVVYSASKAALIGMTKALAKEVAPSGVRVNCVSPGVIITDMTAPLGEETLASLADETPLGRNGAPRDVANAVSFLCSDSASFITGQVLSVNGGFIT